MAYEMSDAELAQAIRDAARDLNHLARHAEKRSLVVVYNMVAGTINDGVTNPKIETHVMTEVA